MVGSLPNAASSCNRRAGEVEPALLYNRRLLACTPVGLPAC